VSSRPLSTLSTRNCTPATPTSSVALAVTVTMSLTSALACGAVIDTLGAVVSPPVELALKATSCSTQALLFWVAVATYEPATVTFRSMVMLPKAVDRVVKPAPGWVTLPREAPAPNSRSLALVVATVPVVIALAVPVAALVTSRGSALSIPEYSLIYSRPNELMAVAKVAVTVLAPPATFLA